MGFVYTEVTLKNLGDVYKAENGLIGEQQVRQETVKAMADTGASTLIINEELQERLGLKAMRAKKVTMANEKKEQCFFTESVEISWKDRETTLRPLVIPGSKEILLGALPLEAMDLMVDPIRQDVIGAHGDEEVYYAM